MHPFEPSQPGPATSLEETHDTGTTISLSWHAPRQAIRPLFTVRYRVKGQSEWIDFHPSTEETSLTVTGLHPKTTYEFEVLTVNQLAKPDHGR